MSGNTLAGGQEDGSDKITFRLPSHLKRQYKDQVDNMSGDLEQYVRRKVEGRTPDGYDTPLAPPRDDEDLRRAYETICELANRNGILRHGTAKRAISGGPNNLSKDEVDFRLLRPLRRRGYIAHVCGPYGRERAWKLRGLDS